MTERSLLFLYGNAFGGREEAYHAWYDQHIREMVRVPGVQSAQRFTALNPAFAQAFPPPPAPYLATYEFDGDPAVVWGAVMAGIDSGAVSAPTDAADPAALSVQVWAPHKGLVENQSATPRGERSRYFVFGNCLAGQEQAYTEWYDNTHLSEVLAVPGVLSAQRYTLAEPEFAQGTPATHRYLALYEFEGDADAVMSGIRAKSASGEMVMHGSLDLETVTMSFWAPRGSKVEATA